MGMVASSQRLATRAGLDVLRAGGHAADAAVAVAAALNVTEPASTGLGGDMFALVYEAGARKVTGLNGSGRAAAALAAGRPFPPHHARAVTVPGACAGWCDLHAKYGRLPLTRALEPAIRLAEEGFPVAPWSAQGWAGGEALLRAHPGGGELLVDGRAPRAGETFRNPTLARTLRTIASGGKDAYYRGGIGRAVVDAVRKAGGDLDDGDLARHASTWTEPISTTYRGHRVWECPPNGQGLTALIALNLLEGFELRGQDPLGADRAHLLLDTLRLAFADTRWYVADPAVSKVPVAELLSKDYAAKRRALIDPRRALPRAMRGAPAAGSDTVYFCVVDAEGNACSFINSNYMGFGTGIVPEGCGFSLQNRGAGFHFEPGHPNVSAPGKRPYHTIIPGMITRADGSLYAPFGVMGGFMQPQGHVQVVVGLLDDGLSPQAAVERPRFCLQPDDAAGRAEFEEGFPAATIRDLEARGHALSGGVSGWARALFGRGQVIRRSREGALEGGSDPRADGDARSTA
jgi:gamma-glutamyltranspeptidase/glutathione hydrolase